MNSWFLTISQKKIVMGWIFKYYLQNLRHFCYILLHKLFFEYAVGLFYTCILQGARQVQGPCCTNPSAYAIHARQKWIMNASCGYSFFLKFIFLHSFCNRNRKSLNWKGQKWNFKVKNVLLAVLALLNHPWIRKAKRESCK